MSLYDPSVTTSPSAEDEYVLEEAREAGFDTVEEYELALEEFSAYDSNKVWYEGCH